MKRFREPLRLHRARARARAGPIPWSTQRRTIMEKDPRGVIIEEKFEPTKKNSPTFELPTAVLELDAEDSPYVRPFSDWDAAQQTAKWGFDPIGHQVMSKATNLRKQIARDDKQMHRQASKLNSVQAISDYNVLAIALLGGPSVSSSLQDLEPPDEQHRPISLGSLRANGIPERVLAGDANKVISFMLHRQQLARAEEDTRESDALNAAVGRCNSLSLLRRLCFRDPGVSSEQKGISHNSVGHVVHALRHMPPQPPRDVLKFINNLTIRQLSDGEGLHPALSRYGLEIASRLRLLSPIVHYLQICLSQGFIGNYYRSVEKLLLVGNGILAALEGGQGTARGTRPGLFTLLTGRSPEISALQPALLGLAFPQTQEDPEAYHLYIRLLAELGAFRLLWHAWDEAQGESGVRALMRCVEVLCSARFHSGMDYMATGDLEEDSDLDLWDIDRMDAYHTSTTTTRLPYSFDSEGVVSPDEVREVFANPDIDRAMRHLRDLTNRAAAVRR